MKSWENSNDMRHFLSVNSGNFDFWVCLKTLSFWTHYLVHLKFPCYEVTFSKVIQEKSYHFVCLKLVPFLKIQKTLIYWKKSWCEMKMCQFNKKNAILVSWNTNKVHKFSTKTPLKCIESNPLKGKKAFSEKTNFQFTGIHNLSESFYENVLTWKKQWILK